MQPLARESLQRLLKITHDEGHAGTQGERAEFAKWIADAIAPRNIAGLAEPEKHNLYPVDFDALVENHALLGLSRNQVIERLSLLRGQV